jgi:hypothetical protein
MFKTPHAIIAGAIVLTFAMPPAAGAKEIAPANAFRDLPVQPSDGVLRGHDLHGADRPASTSHVLAGHDLHAAEAGERSVVNAVAPPSNRVSDRLDWGDAGIGAIGMLGIVLALGGIALFAQHLNRQAGT